MALSELTGMKVQLTNQQTLATFDVTQPDEGATDQPAAQSHFRRDAARR